MKMLIFLSLLGLYGHLHIFSSHVKIVILLLKYHYNDSLNIQTQFETGTVAHASNPSSWEIEIRRMVF
jgi:hypothetical protein